MTTAAASGNGQLAGHVRLIRAAADLIEQAGVPGLALCPGAGRDRHPGPRGHRRRGRPRQGSGPARRPRRGSRRPRPRPGGTRGWVSARGEFAGHPVHIYTAIVKEETS